MKRHIRVGLIVIYTLFAGGMRSAQTADVVQFQALHLARLSQAVALPDVRLPDLDGKQVSLRAFQGKVLLLNFWTTW